MVSSGGRPIVVGTGIQGGSDVGRCLQDRRGRRCQRAVVGGRRPEGGGDGGRLPAGPPGRRGGEARHEGGGRQGRRLPHAHRAFLQARSLSPPPSSSRGGVSRRSVPFAMTDRASGCLWFPSGGAFGRRPPLVVSQETYSFTAPVIE